MDKEVVFKVTRVKDSHWGWHYLARPRHKKLGGATEARSYPELKKNIQEFLLVNLKGDYHKEVGLPKNPQIRLIYYELLFKNPNAESIVIDGTRENGGYRTRVNRTNSFMKNFDLYHKDLETLREQVHKEVIKRGHHTKNVEFRLEEVLNF